MAADDLIKSDLIVKYDAEAGTFDNEQWLKRGGSARPPEGWSSRYFVSRKVKEALKLCGHGFNRNWNALEIGCSYGHMTALLAPKFKNFTAVDLSPHSIKVAEQRMSHYGINNIKFMVDDAEKLETVEDNSFDVIFCFSTLRYISDMQKPLKAIYSKLKPTGIAIVDFPNKKCPWHGLIKPLLGMRPHIHDRLFTIEQVESFYKEAGFTDVAVKQILFTSRQLPGFLLPPFFLLDLIGERIPGVAGYSGIIMIKGKK